MAPSPKYDMKIAYVQKYFPVVFGGGQGGGQGDLLHIHDFRRFSPVYNEFMPVTFLPFQRLA
jgi:hypothetical protein